MHVLVDGKPCQTSASSVADEWKERSNIIFCAFLFIISSKLFMFTLLSIHVLPNHEHTGHVINDCAHQNDIKKKIRAEL